jgi:hypothetical protein
MARRPRFHNDSAMRQGKVFPVPIPTQNISNEEFTPIGQTADQVQVEQVAADLVARTAARRGVTRRDFLKTTGGMAGALLAMNTVFGRFFDIGEAELFEPEAFAEQLGAPYFVFDVQTHYVGSQYDPT